MVQSLILYLLIERKERDKTDMTNSNTYTLYSDAGHGWLRVDVEELYRLGIEYDITTFSYIFGETAYLEEDCDLATFMNAKQSAGETIEIKDVDAGTDSVIRSYNSYTAGRVSTVLAENII
jgi:hypothetical protein